MQVRGSCISLYGPQNASANGVAMVDKINYIKMSVVRLQWFFCSCVLLFTLHLQTCNTQQAGEDDVVGFSLKITAPNGQ